MQRSGGEIENVLFQALAHPMRRAVLKIVGSSQNGITYTELITELGLPTGKLNYHLEQLEGLIEKNDERHYILTSFGKKAVNQLNLIKNEAEPSDERYAKTAVQAQKTSLQPALKSFLLIGAAFSALFVAIWGYFGYIAITEGAPIVYWLLPILIALGIDFLGTLVYAFKKAPEWIRRLEHRFLGLQ